jgi:hypothetical protein
MWTKKKEFLIDCSSTTFQIRRRDNTSSSFAKDGGSKVALSTNQMRICCITPAFAQVFSSDDMLYRTCFYSIVFMGALTCTLDPERWRWYTCHFSLSLYTSLHFIRSSEIFVWRQEYSCFSWSPRSWSLIRHLDVLSFSYKFAILSEEHTYHTNQTLAFSSDEGWAESIS